MGTTLFIISFHYLGDWASDDNTGFPLAVRSQFHLFYAILVFTGFFGGIVMTGSGLFGLWTTWYRSQLYAAVNIIVTFGSAALMLCFSIVFSFWSTKMANYFCDIETVEPDLATFGVESAAFVCTQRPSLYAVIALSWIATVAELAIFSMSVAGMINCGKPPDWKEYKLPKRYIVVQKKLY
eukprot:GHVU01035164.1.p1 GENE.GHVU01035164.1~~GHVU01035164.1.p1  ORF type:complete len:209 (+),score=38.50 GHVU01035164.1:87-629(+)